MPIRDKQVIKISIYFVLAIASLLILSVNGHAITYFDDLRERRIVYIVSYQDGLKYSATDRTHTVSGTINRGEFGKISDLSGPSAIELSSFAGYGSK